MLTQASATRMKLAALLTFMAVALGWACWRMIIGQPAADTGADVVQLEPGVPMSGSAATSRPSEPTSQAASASSVGTVTVHVVGPVKSPGLVVLRTGARVADAVAACGGFTTAGTPDLVNLARTLADGERIDVSAADPSGDGAEVGGDGQAPSGPLNLNTASPEQLDALPGVGPVLAERIVAYRKENGRFASVDQLQEVPGIGPAKFADISDLVTVR